VRVVVIGATGHVGTYLVPMLDEAGHRVVAVSRGKREPYRNHPAFARAEQVSLERTADHAAFAAAIAGLKADAVIDLMCFNLDSAVALAEALRGSISHFLMCGTVWIHGPSSVVPATEEADRRPFGQYGIQKLAITEYLEREARAGRLPATVVHPGHIVGPGWAPLNPQGNFNVEVFRRIAEGQTIRLPHLGMETVHHVHAEDVASLFCAAMANWGPSLGQSFHAVSPGALTLRGYTEAMFAWHGHEPDIEYLPWEAWQQTVSEADALATRDHVSHSPNCSMEKARRLLGFVPRHSSLAAVRESARWLQEHDYQAEP
jgi:nucleoside-diphosphate-sugar epimerase